MEKAEQKIDVVDAIAFFWRAKAYILVGALIGLSAGFAFQKRYRPDVFVSYVPLVVETSREVRAKSLISNMDRMLRTSAHARVIYGDFVANTDDEFRQLLQKLGWTEERFTALQTGQMGAERIPLRIVYHNEEFVDYNVERMNSTGYYLLLSLDLPNISQEIAAKFGRGLRSSLLKINEGVIAKHVDKPGFESVVQSSEFFLKMLETKEYILSTHFRKIHEIEVKLLKRLGSPNHFLGGSDQILRLLEYLLRDNKISRDEALAIQKEKSKIDMEIHKTQLTYAYLDDFNASIRAMDLLDLEALMNLPQTAPIFNVDEAGLHTKYPIGPGVKAKVSKFILFLALGFAIGSLFGLFAYSFKLHLRHRAGLAG
jgi:hypothetical protein